MFYLIGGAPRAGKTTISKRLSAELRIPWISTDTLETIVSRYIDDGAFVELLPKTAARRGTRRSNDVFYTEYSASAIRDLYIKQAETTREAIVAFIECEARSGHDYILEGFHVVPELVVQLQSTYPLRSVFVGREDADETLAAIRRGTAPDDWVINKTSNEETFPKIAEMLALYGTYFRAEAEKRELHYIDMGADFEKGVQKACEYLKNG